MNKISVIIPAAGLATRMRPLSNTTSKSMIPLNGKPIIHYILSKLKTFSEIDEVVIVHSNTNDIENFCSKFSYPFKIKYILQQKPLGPLDAVFVGSNITNLENNICVWLGDTICLEDSFNFENDFLVVSEVKDQSRWCLVDKNGEIFFDKPKEFVDTNLALIGIYNFNNRNIFEWSKDLISLKSHDSEMEISEFLELYKNKKENGYELINTKEWYDCGELSTYYESKARLINNLSRIDNKIDVDVFRGSLTKTTLKNHAKIEAEKKWFLKMDGDIQFFLPKIFNTQIYGQLKMSWESGFPLNELWLYDDIRTDQWILIINKILNVYFDILIDNSKKLKDQYVPNFYEETLNMYITKNINRIIENYQLYGEHFNKIYDFVLNTGLDAIKNAKYSSRIHGDLHLGNILFEPLSGKMTFLDPRGFWANTETTHGDINYDLAKIFHDWYVGYMMILGEKYEIENNKVVLKWDNNKQQAIFNSICEKLIEKNFDIQLLKKMSIVLVLTCIPFHSDDINRQKVFVKRCLNLIEYEEF